MSQRVSNLSELLDVLSVARLDVGKLPGILKAVEDSLRDALLQEERLVDAFIAGRRTAAGSSRPLSIKDLVELTPGTSPMVDAEGRLREAESRLIAHLKGVRSGLTLLERKLARRRGPGRPAELTGSELSVAKYERANGKSWAQVHKSINALRRELNQIRGGKEPVPTIPLTTLRTAIEPRHAKKSRP